MRYACKAPQKLSAGGSPGPGPPSGVPSPSGQEEPYGSQPPSSNRSGEVFMPVSRALKPRRRDEPPDVAQFPGALRTARPRGQIFPGPLRPAPAALVCVGGPDTVAPLRSGPSPQTSGGTGGPPRELTVEPEAQAVERAQPPVPLPRVPVGAGDRRAGRLDDARPERLRGEGQRLGVDQ